MVIFVHFYGRRFFAPPSHPHVRILAMPLLDAIKAAFLGGFRLHAFAHLPAVGTRGGVVILWDDELIRTSAITVGAYCISMTVSSIREDVSFCHTSVYGPTVNSRKEEFFAELLAHKTIVRIKWMVNMDFNQIYRAPDKNKRNAS